jgi:hypothetical protein
MLLAIPRDFFEQEGNSESCGKNLTEPLSHLLFASVIVGILPCQALVKEREEKATWCQSSQVES